MSGAAGASESVTLVLYFVHMMVSMVMSTIAYGRSHMHVIIPGSPYASGFKMCGGLPKISNRFVLYFIS